MTAVGWGDGERERESYWAWVFLFLAGVEVEDSAAWALGKGSIWRPARVEVEAGTQLGKGLLGFGAD